MCRRGKFSRNYEVARFTEIVKEQLSGVPVGDKQLLTSLFPIFMRKLRWGEVEEPDLKTVADSTEVGRGSTTSERRPGEAAHFSGQL